MDSDNLKQSGYFLFIPYLFSNQKKGKTMKTAVFNFFFCSQNK